MSRETLSHPRAVAAPPRDRLYHVWFIASRWTLCGQPRDTSQPGQPFDDSSHHPDDCVVCAGLASAFIDGTWQP